MRQIAFVSNAGRQSAVPTGDRTKGRADVGIGPYGGYDGLPGSRPLRYSRRVSIIIQQFSQKGNKVLFLRGNLWYNNKYETD